jgi:outer membrane protein
MLNKLNKYGLLLGICMPAFVITTKSQSVSDTLRFQDVVNYVVQNNPLIKESMEKVKSSELAVKLTRTAYLPTLDINATYSRIAPIPAFDFPSIGHIQMYPDNSLAASLDARQLLYDFGKTNRTVELQETSNELAALSTEQIKEKLVMASAGYFYSLTYLQAARNITNEHLNTLRKHVKYIEDKQITGSATQYEILSTRVKVSAAETQLSELETNFQVQLSHLNSLMGTHLNNIVLDYDTTAIESMIKPDSSFEFATTHKDELLISQKKQALEQMNYNMIKVSNNPMLGVFASGGFKNGYLPEVEKERANYVVGLTLKVPVFDGNRKNLKLQMANCSINQSNYEIENTNRQIHDEITESYSLLLLSEKKIEQSKMQLQQAQEAYNHAEVNFREGVITNLDLIYAEDMLSDSKLMLLKNTIDYQVNMLKFKAAMGERLY